MSKDIEKISSVIPEEYDYLFDLDERIQESQNLDIDELILKVSTEDGKLHFARRVSYLDSRALSQIDQKRLSDEKAQTYLQKTSLFLEGAAVAFHVASAVFGGNATLTGNVYSAFASSMDKAAQYIDKTMSSKQERLGFNSQRHGNLFSDFNQQSQAARDGYEKDANAIDRMIANSRRQAEAVLGG